MMWELIADSNYMVSTEGGVCFPPSTRCGQHVPLKQRSDGRGYMCVDIKVAYKPVTVKVHKLVAETFLGPTPNGYHIDHIDHDKTNNRLNNLRWRKAGENSADCKRGPRTNPVRRNPNLRDMGRYLYLHGWDTKEIADALCVGETTVRRWKKESKK